MAMEYVKVEEDVHNVLTQEIHELIDILSNQEDDFLNKLFGIMERRVLEQLLHLASHRERIMGLLDYLRVADPAICRRFLQMVCMNYDMPMRLESRLMSVAGPVTLKENNSHTLVDEYTPSQESCVKRPRMDHVESYKASVSTFLQQRWEKVRQGVVKEVRLEEAWVSLRNRNPFRPRDRAERGPSPSELQERGEDGAVEDKVTVESLLHSAAQITLLLGQAGSGKTLLMYCLGQRWAQGAFPSSQLLFLLEFRQLNLVVQPLSLKELLFRCFLSPEGGEEEGVAVLDFILHNPEKICLIFDGYDEFHTKITHLETQSSSFDPLSPVPMAELIAGLCSGRILPGCTLLITCRPRDVTDLETLVDCIRIGWLLGFNKSSVKEYADQYFQDRGEDLKKKAVGHLLSNHQLLTMSYLPALCHICCVCLEHMFSGGMSQTQALPTTLTQVYLQILFAFLSQCPGSDPPVLETFWAEVTQLSQLAMRGLEASRIVFLSEEVPSNLLDFATKAGLLSLVDLTHENGSKGQGYVFMHLTMQEFLGALHIMTSKDITEALLRKKFNLKSRWTTKSDPKNVFTDSLHLYLCGFAAPACSSYLIQLVRGVGAAGWVNKRQALVLKILRSLAMSTTLTGPKLVELCRCVQETQDAQLAREVVGSRPCFELRNIRLNPVDLDAVAFVVSSAGIGCGLDFGACSMELECLDILPSCQHIDYLIFRSRKYDDKFADKLSCILPRLPTMKRFEFICGNLTDVGAAKLAKALRRCPQIKQLNFSDNSLTDRGVREIADIFPILPFLTIDTSASHTESPTVITQTYYTNLLFSYYLGCEKYIFYMGLSFSISKNALGNKGLKNLLDLLPHLGTIQEINVSENAVNMEGVVFLASKLASHRNMSEVNISHGGKKNLFLIFQSNKRTFFVCSLTHSSIQPSDMAKLCERLVRCPGPLVLDFSHGSLRDDAIERLLRILPKMTSLQLLNMSHVQMSTNGALLLVRSLIDCQHVRAVKLMPQGEAFIKFANRKTDQATSAEVWSHPMLNQVRRRKWDGYTCMYLCVKGSNVMCQCVLFRQCIFPISIDETWITAEAAVNLVSCCLNLNPKIHTISKLFSFSPYTHFYVFSTNLTGPQSISFSLSGHVISDRGAVLLSTTLQKLLSHCYGWTEAGALDIVRGLGQCRSLEGICLESVELDEGSTECLACGLRSMTSLKSLNKKVTMATGSTGEGATVVLLASLEGLSGMEEIELEGMRMTDKGVGELIKHLPSWKGLRKISLSENHISDQAGERLLQALSSCTALEELNKIHNLCNPPQYILCIHSPRDSSSLDLLSFSLTSIGTSELTGLAGSLVNWICAEDVSFAWNGCGDDVAVKLSEVLPQCQKLRRLDLESNRISMKGAEALARSLQSCSSVEVIRLWRNAISNSDAQRLRQGEKRLNFSST
uniref:NACHT domain-containing protein n=1 Tax=Esox lucius TaxID=8010 RepID=A0A6Q2ZGV2_ESOLU